MSKRPAILTAGLCIAVLGVAAAAWLLSSRRDARVTRAPITSETIVMFGDSITQEAPWAAAFPDLPISNRGYSGFTTEQLVDVAREIAELQPRAVYILSGANDIRDERSPEWTVRHFETILDEFADAAPDTTVVVQTILPQERAPDRVRATNEAIRRLAAERGLDVIDTHAVFDDGAGALRQADTSDGIHLTEAGNRRWTDLLGGEFARR